MALPGAAAAIPPCSGPSRHVFELTETHRAIPVIPLLLVSLLNVKPHNGLGLGGDDGPAGVEMRQSDQLQQDIEPTRLLQGYI